jgi:phage shock protein PspC (stress-responsive transcriptional regulator)
MTAPQTPRLVRPKEGRMIAGVAAGLADRFGMERSIMRLIFVLSLILPGPQILIYIVLWVIIPEDG